MSDSTEVDRENSDSVALITKDEEKQPLIQTTSQLIPKPVGAINYQFSGDEADDEDSDRRRFATDSQVLLNEWTNKKRHKSRLIKMNSNAEHLTTNMQTMMHLLKGNIGTGILAMPSAFANAGLWMGTIALPIMGIICIHCMHMLINCNRILCQKIQNTQLDYEEVASEAFKSGPLSLRKYASVARQTVSLFLLITQFGFCCVYGLFVSENLRQVFKGLSENKIDLDVHVYMLLMIPFFIVLNFIRSLKHLAIASAIANLLQSTGLLIVFYNLMQNIPHTWERPAAVDISRFPLYMGTAIYAFEGIGLVLPLQKEMREPESFGGAIGVLNTGMVVVACLYTAIGFFGYLKFGDGVLGSITLNLPSEPLYETCRLMFTIAIFLSYAIQFYVPFNIIWPWMKHRYHLKPDCRRTRIFELLLRAVLVIATFGLAAAIPRLDLFISLVGALSSSCLALIFPPIIEVATRWGDKKDVTYCWFMYSKNIGILLIGLLGFFTGTYASVREIITAFMR